MKLNFKIDNLSYSIDTNTPIDISIEMDFKGKQPNTYDVPKAKSEVYKDDNFIGDVNRGGPCNFETLTITPHCNGTHTECVGHITKELISISTVLQNNFFPAQLITIQPLQVNSIKESYVPEISNYDLLITKQSLVETVKENSFLEALIIRTLPNDDSKISKNYQGNDAPYFTNEAMEYISKLGVKHLLVDMPSIDRLHDEGKLSNHHIFWNIEQGKNIITDLLSDKTITEFIYVDNEVKDGNYILDLRVPSFKSDAVMSRPVLYNLNKK